MSVRPGGHDPVKHGKSASGIGPNGWVPAFEGQRRPFERGHELSTRHGSYATLALGPRVDELADELRPLVPAYTSSDEVALRLLCLALARLERSEGAIGSNGIGADEMQRLRSDSRGWLNSCRRLLNDLAMTPTSRASLALEVAKTRGEFDSLAARLTAIDQEDDEQ